MRGYQYFTWEFLVASYLYTLDKWHFGICVCPVTVQHAGTSDWLRDVSISSLTISELPHQISTNFET